MKNLSRKLKDSINRIDESIEQIKVVEQQQEKSAKCWAKIASICELYIRSKNANN